MNDSRSMSSAVRRVWIPLVVAIVLVVGTVLISTSSLIRLEDININRILAGTYGTPDWRVQEMNPLLAQLLTLLYRILPSVNWYGVLLLALLAVAAAAGIGLAARRRGGLIPAVIVVSPIVVLLTNAVISTAVGALAAAVGALSLMDGMQRRREGLPRAIMGGVLFAFAAMLSMQWAVIVGIAAVLCWLPRAVRDERMRGLVTGLLLLAVIAAALFGYSALMYGSPELTAYRQNYALYERLQHSNLKDEAETLANEYGTATFDEDHSTHDHDGDGIPDGEEHEHEDDIVIPPNSFDAVGWNLNDASLFFTRYSADSKLTDPEVLRVLEKEASYWNLSPSYLAGKLLETALKPQFLMMIGLFIISALAVLITSRGRGLVVLLAAVIAFGGHVAMLAHYYDAFANIAPFYLVSIAAMLYFFNGEDAKAWFGRVLRTPWLRIGATALVAVVFVGAMGGLLYYTSITPANSGTYTVMAVQFLKPYIQEHPEYLFVGENPNDRYKPATLAAPVRNENPTLLAGSYDLYSPRGAALMEQFGVTNPLLDSIGREDIAYVLMGFAEPVTTRLASEYQLYAKEPTELWAKKDAYEPLAEMIVQWDAYTLAEIEEMYRQIEENEAEYQRQLEEFEANIPELTREDLLNMGMTEEEVDAAFAAAAEQAAQDADDHDHDHDHATEDDHDHDDDHVHSEAEPTASTAPNE